MQTWDPTRAAFPLLLLCCHFRPVHHPIPAKGSRSRRPNVLRLHRGRLVSVCKTCMLQSTNRLLAADVLRNSMKLSANVCGLEACTCIFFKSVAAIPTMENAPKLVGVVPLEDSRDEFASFDAL